MWGVGFIGVFKGVGLMFSKKGQIEPGAFLKRIQDHPQGFMCLQYTVLGFRVSGIYFLFQGLGFRV